MPTSFRPSWWEQLLASVGPSSAEAIVVGKDPHAQRLIDATASGEIMAPNPTQAETIRRPAPPRTFVQIPARPAETDPLTTGAFDPVKKQIYKDIVTSAQARPETATVEYRQSMPANQNAAYNPETNDIRLRQYVPSISMTGRTYADPPPTAINYQNSLAHELTHFLMKHIGGDLQANPARAMPPTSSLLQWLMLPTSPRSLRQNVPPIIQNTASQHALIKYLLGDDQAPGSLEEYGQQTPLQPQHVPRMQDETARALYIDAVKQILRDPAILQQALQGIQQAPLGARR